MDIASCCCTYLTFFEFLFLNLQLRTSEEWENVEATNLNTLKTQRTKNFRRMGKR